MEVQIHVERSYAFDLNILHYLYQEVFAWNEKHSYISEIPYWL